jgi:diaminopimelate epimerase
MKIPFTKAHGARNDFLLTWRGDLPLDADFAEIARAICDRHTGVGADGWLLVTLEPNPRIDLWNSDGSTSPISGNGTRCAAAFLIDAKRAESPVDITTGAGVKRLELLERQDQGFVFEMNMGAARVDELHAKVHGRDAVILDVGNPQCAVFVDDFDFDWATLGAAIECDPRFPKRTNVSFVQVINRNTIDVRFFERGAGVTMSSGTGSTGAGAAAVARGLCDDSTLEVRTPAGPLQLRWRSGEILLAGPAEIVATGEFYWRALS